MENIFYFKHRILNTPCPPSPGARLRDLKTIFYNWFFKFISHQACSHSTGGRDAGSAAAPAPGGVSQPGGFRGAPQEPSPARGDGGVSGKLLGRGGTDPCPARAGFGGACCSAAGLGTPRGTGRMRAAPSFPPSHLGWTGGGGSPPARVSDVMKCQLLPSLSSASLKPTWFNQESLQFISS